jgi:hypothetical protein
MEDLKEFIEVFETDYVVRHTHLTYKDLSLEDLFDDKIDIDGFYHYPTEVLLSCFKTEGILIFDDFEPYKRVQQNFTDARGLPVQDYLTYNFRTSATIPHIASWQRSDVPQQAMIAMVTRKFVRDILQTLRASGWYRFAWKQRPVRQDYKFAENPNKVWGISASLYALT